MLSKLDIVNISLIKANLIQPKRSFVQQICACSLFTLASVLQSYVSQLIFVTKCPLVFFLLYFFSQSPVYQSLYSLFYSYKPEYLCSLCVFLRHFVTYYVCTTPIPPLFTLSDWPSVYCSHNIFLSQLVQLKLLHKRVLLSFICLFIQAKSMSLHSLVLQIKEKSITIAMSYRHEMNSFYFSGDLCLPSK